MDLMSVYLHKSANKADFVFIWCCTKTVKQGIKG